MTEIPDERLIYGCFGADRPEALPYLVEVDGILTYTCPECRETLAEIDHPTTKEMRLPSVR